MLILTRQPGQWLDFHLPDGRLIRIALDARAKMVIDAPRDVVVLRSEVPRKESPCPRNPKTAAR